MRCCAISNALFGATLGLLTLPLELGLLEDDEKPLEGFTALGLLEEKPLELGLLEEEEREDENPEEREEEKLEDREEENPPEREDENPLPFASITGSISIENPRSRYLIYLFIVLVRAFNI